MSWDDVARSMALESSAWGPHSLHTAEATAGDVGCWAISYPLPCAEDVMAARKQWSDLSERTRRLLITAAVAEGILKVAALIDLKHRPASQIRGPKWIWVAVLAVVSSAGVVPVSYFVFGRRQPRSQFY